MKHPKADAKLFQYMGLFSESTFWTVLLPVCPLRDQLPQSNRLVFLPEGLTKISFREEQLFTQADIE